MSDKLNPQRIKNLYQMLFEMATGNLSFRIPATAKSDGIQRLSEALNAVATAMQSEISKSEFVYPQYSYQNLVQITFILDTHFSIRDTTKESSEVLGYEPPELLDRPFENFIATQSVALWQQLKNELISESNYEATAVLIFLTKEKKCRPAFCAIAKTVRNKDILVSSVTTILQDILPSNSEKSFAIVPKLADPELTQRVYAYIIANLENPLPSLPQLSKIFGVNEFRLKDSFKHFFGTSIYQFYNDERLKKAHNLITTTEIPLKSIPYTCGFNDYGVFSKAFKKKYQYSPRELFRKAPSD